MIKKIIFQKSFWSHDLITLSYNKQNLHPCFIPKLSCVIKCNKEFI